jgi:hypothetical protein
MEDILDEQLEESKIKIPLVIYLFMTAIFIYFLGSLIVVQSWPYGRVIQFVGTLSILITGGLVFKLFKAKSDLFLNLYWGVFMYGGFSTIAIRFVAYDTPLRPLLDLGGRFFIIAVLLALSRYFVVERPRKTSLNIIRYPLLATIPMWVISILFKMQSWSYASEMITISAFVFLLGTVIMLILKLKMEVPILRPITVWLVIMINMLVFGCLFKIQSWPYGSELITVSFFGGVLGIMIKLMQQQKLLKEQVNND